MSVNRERPHLVILPEDDANRQLANGFLLELSSDKVRNVRVLPPVGGWRKVFDSFFSSHLAALKKFPHRHLVLLIDFDGHVEDRRQCFADKFPQDVPQDVRNRVFLLGTKDEPENLKEAPVRSFETIGKTLADECYREEINLWAHEQLVHNASERERLNAKAQSFLF